MLKAETLLQPGWWNCTISCVLLLLCSWSRGVGGYVPDTRIAFIILLSSSSSFSSSSRPRFDACLLPCAWNFKILLCLRFALARCCTRGISITQCFSWLYATSLKKQGNYEQEMFLKPQANQKKCWLVYCLAVLVNPLYFICFSYVFIQFRQVDSRCWMHSCLKTSVGIEELFRTGFK